MAKPLVEHNAVGTQISSGNEALDWRIDCFTELGFEHTDAVALASSTEVAKTGGKDENSKVLTWNPPLHHMKVKKALDAGCTHELAVKLFVNSEAT